MAYIWASAYALSFLIIIAVCYWIERGGSK